MGASGLIIAVGLYSIPAHLDLPFYFAMIGVSAVFLVLGFVIRGREKSKRS